MTRFLLSALCALFAAGLSPALSGELSSLPVGVTLPQVAPPVASLPVGEKALRSYELRNVGMLAIGIGFSRPEDSNSWFWSSNFSTNLDGNPNDSDTTVYFPFHYTNGMTEADLLAALKTAAFNFLAQPYGDATYNITHPRGALQAFFDLPDYHTTPPTRVAIYLGAWTKVWTEPDPYHEWGGDPYGYQCEPLFGVFATNADATFTLHQDLSGHWVPDLTEVSNSLAQVTNLEFVAGQYGGVPLVIPGLHRMEIDEVVPDGWSYPYVTNRWSTDPADVAGWTNIDARAVGSTQTILSFGWNELVLDTPDVFWSGGALDFAASTTVTIDTVPPDDPLGLGWEEKFSVNGTLVGDSSDGMRSSYAGSSSLITATPTLKVGIVAAPGGSVVWATGRTGETVSIQSSTDLKTWKTIGEATVGEIKPYPFLAVFQDGGEVAPAGVGVISQPSRFYRAFVAAR